ncbi:heme ABC exporter ATP-binding protein CcmA [Rhodobacter sp.]
MTITVSDLAVQRGGIVVLEGVSFVLPPGRALVLRGPNGVGKTTLLRTVAGLQPAVAGRIEMPAESLGLCQPCRRAEGRADGGREPVVLGGGLRHGGVEEAMQRMDLHALRRRRAASLSAGQKRRLGLARLLVSGRAVWALDEPTVSLDAASVALFASVVRDHLAAGGSALIATHIDLGLQEAAVLDLTPFRARPGRAGADTGFQEAFL